LVKVSAILAAALLVANEIRGAVIAGAVLWPILKSLWGW
jgi:hypothetical protein